MHGSLGQPRWRGASGFGTLPLVPIEFDVDPERRLVVARATGRIGWSELQEYFAKVWTRDDLRGFSEIFDWTGSEGVSLSVAELRNLAGAARTFYDPSSAGRLALVVPSSDTKNAHLYRTLRELRSKSGPEIRIFEERSAAEAWMATRPPS